MWGGVLPSAEVQSVYSGREVNAFLKGISLELNIIVSLEFEHPYYDIAVLHISQHAMGTPTVYIYIYIYVCVCVCVCGFWSIIEYGHLFAFH